MSIMRMSAKLDRTDQNTSWGFRMTGGKDFGQQLTIQRVTPGSLAAKCGVQVGDAIIRIGGTPTDHLRHKDAQQYIIDSGNSLELTLERGGGSSHATQHVDSPGYAPSPSFGGGYGGQQPSYNVAPKPFSGGGGSNYSNSVGSLTSQTAALNFGSAPPRSQDVTNLNVRSSSPVGSRGASPARSASPKPAVSAKPGTSKPAPSKPAPPATTKPAVPSTTKPSLPSTGKPALPSTTKPSLPNNSKPAVPSTKPSNVQSSATNPANDSGAESIPSDVVLYPPSGLYTGPVTMVTQPGETLEEIFDPAHRAEPEAPAWAEQILQNVPKPVVHIYARPEEVIVERNTIVIRKESNPSKDEDITISTERKKIVIPPRKTSLTSTTETTSTENDGEKKKHFLSETFRLIQDEGSGNPQHQYNQLTGAEFTFTISDNNLIQSDIIEMPKERKTIVIPSKKSQNTSPGGGDDVVDMPSERKTILVPVNKLHSSSGGGYRGPSATSPAPASRPGAWNPIVPTGDRKMRVGKIGEAKSLPAAVGGVRIPVCSGCGTAIRGPFVSALDKTWCPDHFICANPNCRVPLINCGFVEEAGQLFCEKDYEQYFAPRCGTCGRAIIGEVVNALKNTYHMDCFLCHQCHQPIGTGSFHNEDGKIYCPKDWALMFQTKCYGCQFPIEPGDRWVEALSQNWHSECFNCSTCQVNLEGQSFFAKNGKPYCKKHSTTARF